MSNLAEQLRNAESLFNESHLDEAEVILRGLLKEFPDNPEVLNDMGVLSWVRNETRTALEYIGRALDLNPGYKDAALNFADILKSLGQFDLAAPVLELVVARLPEDPDLKHLFLESLALAEKKKELDETNPPLPAKKPWRFDRSCFTEDPKARFDALGKELNRQLGESRFDLAENSLLRLAAMTHYRHLGVVQGLVKLYQRTDAIPAIQKAWKRAAMSALEEGNIDEFLLYHYQSVHAELFFGKNPKYRHTHVDQDFNTAIRLMAPRHPLFPWIREHGKKLRALENNETVRIGFLLEGLGQLKAPNRIMLPLFEHHDPSRFKLYAYSRIGMNHEVARRENYAAMAQEIQELGVTIRTPSEMLSPSAEVEYICRNIVEDGIDVLCFQNTYFVPVYNLISCLRPAPLQALLLIQQPEYSREMDLVFTRDAAAMECSAPVKPFPMALSKAPNGTPINRLHLGMPENAVLAVSANREIKYAQTGFWREIQAALSRNPNLYFAALGLEQVGNHLPADFPHRNRVLTPGFVKNVPDWLAAADFYVDLFPMGGGTPAMESLAVGLPLLHFEESFDDLYNFSQINVMPGLISIPELAAPYGDFASWRLIFDRLVKDPGFRLRMKDAMLKRAKDFDPLLVAERFYTQLLEAYEAKRKNVPAL